MIQSNIQIILYITGGITASVFLQFLAPALYLRTMNKVSVEGPIGLFFARAWALPVAAIGVLLIWAGIEPALRVPVILVAAVAKALFVATIFANRKAVGSGYNLTAIFDTVCVLLYAGYLLGL